MYSRSSGLSMSNCPGSTVELQAHPNASAVALHKEDTRNGSSVAFAYDPRSSLHAPPLGDRVSAEDAGRTEIPFRVLSERGLVQECRPVAARLATEAELLAVHTPGHLEAVTTGEVAHMVNGKRAADVFINEHSEFCGKLAAGMLLESVDMVCSGTSQSAFALIRPPGHHCLRCGPDGRSGAMGFNFYNNVAIAAQHAIDTHKLERVLVVDWDFHHGNGTFQSFISSKQVLFISLHRGPDVFPGGMNKAHDCGFSEGEGYSVNVCWDFPGVNDAEYRAAFEHIIMPIARDYDPQLVLVSAGFDSCHGDTIGDIDLSYDCFGWMTRTLMELSAGKVVLALEGGYVHQNIAEASDRCIRALLGAPLDQFELEGQITAKGASVLREVYRAQLPYWPDVTDPAAELGIATFEEEEAREAAIEQSKREARLKAERDKRKGKGKGRPPSRGKGAGNEYKD